MDNREQENQPLTQDVEQPATTTQRVQLKQNLDGTKTSTYTRLWSRGAVLLPTLPEGFEISDQPSLRTMDLFMLFHLVLPNILLRSGPIHLE